MKKGQDELPSVMPTIFKAFNKDAKWFFFITPIYFASSIIAPICIQILIRVIQANKPDSNGVQPVVTDFFQSDIFGYIISGIVLVVQVLYAWLDTMMTTYGFRIATQGF